MRIYSLMTFINCMLWALLLGAVEPIQAQQSDPPRSSVTVHTDLVVTWAQITSRNDGTAVKGLGIDDFLLREEGKPQQISFVKEGQPLSVVILVNGWACKWASEHEFQGSHEALRQLGDDAEIALMAWDSDVRLVQPLTRDRNVVADRLEDRVSFFHALNGPENVPRPDRDSYRPGEAIYQAARYLEKAASFERRKIIIVITWYWPGMRMAQTHPHTGAEVEALLKKTGTTVYALFENYGYRRRLGYDDISPISLLYYRKDKQRQRSGGTIEQAIALTGGSSFVSGKKGDDELLITLTSLIRSSYTIGYYPQDASFDGRFRRIGLELSRDGKTKAGKVDIKTRDGYQALRPSPPVAAETRPESH